MRVTQSPTSRFQHWRRPLSGLLTLAVCVWLLAVATHFHVTGEDHSGQVDKSHVCEMCAALSVGAPVAAPTFHYFTGQPAAPIAAPLVRFVSVASLASYQSRAPPAR